LNSVSPARSLQNHSSRKRQHIEDGLHLLGTSESVHSRVHHLVSKHDQEKDMLDTLRLFVVEHLTRRDVAARNANCDSPESKTAKFIPKCNGRSNLCVSCALSKSRGLCVGNKCVLMGCCFVCLDPSHGVAQCKVSKKLTSTGTKTCFGCGLPGDDTGAHVDASNNVVAFMVPCKSYAADVLVPVCWTVFRDQTAMADSSNPVRGMRDVNAF